MKKWVVLILVLVLCFAYVNRQRLFLRDPLGSVVRDGVKEAGAQVFINYSNDVLIENDNTPMYFNIVQHDQPVGAPDGLKCIHYLLCLANGYPAPQTMSLPNARLESMTPQLVRFKDSEGREVQVHLR